MLSLVNVRGYFKDNKKHTFICAFVNIIISLVLVKFYKLDGLLIGTSLAYLLNIIMKIGLVNKKIFKGINSRIYLYYGLIILSLVGICLFIKNIEVVLFEVMTSIPIVVFILFVIFISLMLFIFGIFNTFSKSSRDLYDRGKLLLKTKKN